MNRLGRDGLHKAELCTRNIMMKNINNTFNNINNLQFTNDTDALAEEEQELGALVESLNKICTRYKMEINAKKTKLMTKSADGIHREIKVKGQKLGTVTSFKYLEAVVQMMAPNQRFSQGLHKPLQFLQS